jgi:hypothetical protein
LADAAGSRANVRFPLQIMGREVVVAVTNGRLDGFAELTEIFGTWEGILCQPSSWPGSLDGRRRKRVLVKIVGA